MILQNDQNDKFQNNKLLTVFVFKFNKKIKTKFHFEYLVPDYNSSKLIILIIIPAQLTRYLSNIISLARICDKNWH